MSDPEQVAIWKTVQILLNKVIYADSYLRVWLAIGNRPIVHCRKRPIICHDRPEYVNHDLASRRRACTGQDAPTSEEQLAKAQKPAIER